MIHVATVWQIALATDQLFAAPVASVFTTTDLLTIPSIAGLTPLIDYLARANFLFDDSSSSGFGASTAFTTLAADLIPDPGQPTVWDECA